MSSTPPSGRDLVCASAETDPKVTPWRGGKKEDAEQQVLIHLDISEITQSGVIPTEGQESQGISPLTPCSCPGGGRQGGYSLCPTSHWLHGLCPWQSHSCLSPWPLLPCYKWPGEARASLLGPKSTWFPTVHAVTSRLSAVCWEPRITV